MVSTVKDGIIYKFPFFFNLFRRIVCENLIIFSMTGKIPKGGDEMNEHYTKLSPIDMEILSEAEKKLASSTGKTVAGV